MITEENNELTQYLIVLSKLKDIIQEDIMAAIANRTHFIGYFPGDRIRVPEGITGKEVAQNALVLKAMNTNQVVLGIPPKELYGFLFK